jgi:hypothetical protein
MHSRGIIHRDMKAANIILTSSGEVKLGAGRLTLDAALTPPHTHARARPFETNPLWQRTLVCRRW